MPTPVPTKTVIGLPCQMLCDFAHRFPPFVESFLECGRTLRRSFREETITDLMMGGLMTAGIGQVIVEFPDEVVTGADMEWNFVDWNSHTFFRILLQAKRAYGDGGVWTRHCYRELFHKSGSGSILQAKTLCDTARNSVPPTYPLYILYHPTRTCRLAQQAGTNTVVGVNLANGYVIERLITSANSRTLRTSNKSLKVIAPNLFFLTDIFCPPNNVVPTPQEVRSRLVEICSAVGATVGEASIDDLPQVPDVANAIPDEVRAIIRRGALRKTGERKPLQELPRRSITFVSGTFSACL